jgi:hypothetical protein
MNCRLFSSGWVGGAVILFTVLFLIAGCKKAQPAGTVKGKVTLNGQPYSNARLNFLNQATRAASAADIEGDGSYRLATPMSVGTYTVFLTPKTIADPDHPSTATGIDPKVPEKCWNDSTSPIRIEIKQGQHEVPIELAK